MVAVVAFIFVMYFHHLVCKRLVFPRLIFYDRDSRRIQLSLPPEYDSKNWSFQLSCRHRPVSISPLLSLHIHVPNVPFGIPSSLAEVVFPASLASYFMSKKKLFHYMAGSEKCGWVTSISAKAPKHRKALWAWSRSWTRCEKRTVILKKLRKHWINQYIANAN